MTMSKSHGGLQTALHSLKYVLHVDKLMIIQCIRSKVNSPLAS